MFCSAQTEKFPTALKFPFQGLYWGEPNIHTYWETVLKTPLDQYYGRLYRIVREIGIMDFGIEDQDCEDLLQILMLKWVSFRVWERYTENFGKLNWAYSWVRHGVRGYLRDQYRQVHTRDHHLYQTELNSLNGLSEAPGSLPETIPPKLSLRDLTVTALKFRGYSDSETRGVTGMSKSIYEDSLHRVRKILRTGYSGSTFRVYTGKRDPAESELPVYVPSELQALIEKYKQNPNENRDRERILWKKTGRKPYKNLVLAEVT